MIQLSSNTPQQRQASAASFGVGLDYGDGGARAIQGAIGSVGRLSGTIYQKNKELEDTALREGLENYKVFLGQRTAEYKNALSEGTREGNQKANQIWAEIEGLNPESNEYGFNNYLNESDKDRYNFDYSKWEPYHNNFRDVYLGSTELAKRERIGQIYSSKISSIYSDIDRMSKVGMASNNYTPEYLGTMLARLDSNEGLIESASDENRDKIKNQLLAPVVSWLTAGLDNLKDNDPASYVNLASWAKDRLSFSSFTGSESLSSLLQRIDTTLPGVKAAGPTAKQISSVEDAIIGSGTGGQYLENLKQTVSMSGKGGEDLAYLSALDQIASVENRPALLKPDATDDSFRDMAERFNVPLDRQNDFIDRLKGLRSSYKTARDNGDYDTMFSIMRPDLSGQPRLDTLGQLEIVASDDSAETRNKITELRSLYETELDLATNEYLPGIQNIWEAPTMDQSKRAVELIQRLYSAEEIQVWSAINDQHTDPKVSSIAKMFRAMEYSPNATGNMLAYIGDLDNVRKSASDPAAKVSVEPVRYRLAMVDEVVEDLLFGRLGFSDESTANGLAKATLSFGTFGKLFGSAQKTDPELADAFVVQFAGELNNIFKINPGIQKQAAITQASKTISSNFDSLEYGDISTVYSRSGIREKPGYNYKKKLSGKDLHKGIEKLALAVFNEPVAIPSVSGRRSIYTLKEKGGRGIMEITGIDYFKDKVFSDPYYWSSYDKELYSDLRSEFPAHIQFQRALEKGDIQYYRAGDKWFFRFKSDIPGSTAINRPVEIITYDKKGNVVSQEPFTLDAQAVHDAAFMRHTVDITQLPY